MGNKKVNLQLNHHLVLHMFLQVQTSFEVVDLQYISNLLQTRTNQMADRLYISIELNLKYIIILILCGFINLILPILCKIV